MARAYPERPIVGVGAVIVTAGGEVVLVRRGHEPLKGEWSLPGGAVEVGETVIDAVSREVAEETGLRVEVGPLIEVIDRIVPDAEGRVQYHFVLLDYVCRPLGGTLEAGSDAHDVTRVMPERLADLGVALEARQVVRRGLELAPWSS